MRRLFFVLCLLLTVGFLVNIVIIGISTSRKIKDATDWESEEPLRIELSDEEIEMRHWIKLRELTEEN